MNTRQLEAFQAVMKTGSMSDAARLIEVTQPAVSRLIKDLETNLSFKLFLRENGRLYPTTGAQRFYNEVQRHFVGIERLQQTVDEIRSMKADSLRLAAMPALANSLLPDIVARFSRSEAELSINFDSANSQEIASQVAGQQYDLGIISLPVVGDEIQYGACFSVNCRLIAPQGHFLAQQDSASINDLDRQSFIPCGASHELSRRKLNQHLSDNLIRPSQLIETNHFHNAAMLVKNNMGLAVIDPFNALCHQQQGGASLAFEPTVPFYFGFIMPASRKTSPLVQRFMDHLEAQLIRSIPLQPVDPSQINHRH